MNKASQTISEPNAAILDPHRRTALQLGLFFVFAVLAGGLSNVQLLNDHRSREHPHLKVCSPLSPLATALGGSLAYWSYSKFLAYWSYSWWLLPSFGVSLPLVHAGPKIAWCWDGVLLPSHEWVLMKAAGEMNGCLWRQLVELVRSTLFGWSSAFIFISNYCFDSEVWRWMWLTMEEVVTISFWKMHNSSFLSRNSQNQLLCYM